MNELLMNRCLSYLLQKEKKWKVFRIRDNWKWMSKWESTNVTPLSNTANDSNEYDAWKISQSAVSHKKHCDPNVACLCLNQKDLHITVIEQWGILYFSRENNRNRENEECNNGRGRGNFADDRTISGRKGKREGWRRPNKWLQTFDDDLFHSGDYPTRFRLLIWGHRRLDNRYLRMSERSTNERNDWGYVQEKPKWLP